MVVKGPEMADRKGELALSFVFVGLRALLLCMTKTHGGETRI